MCKLQPRPTQRQNNFSIRRLISARISAGSAAKKGLPFGAAEVRRQGNRNKARMPWEVSYAFGVLPRHFSRGVRNVDSFGAGCKFHQSSQARVVSTVESCGQKTENRKQNWEPETPSRGPVPPNRVTFVSSPPEPAHQ